MSELFDDHSPLRLGTAGKVPDDVAGRVGLTGAFTLVGRLQIRYAEGVWNEWHLLFDGGATGWLSEDNGRFALTRDVGQVPAEITPARLRAGTRLKLAGGNFEVSSITRATLISAQGELPVSAKALAFDPSREWWLADARAGDGRVATLDWAEPSAARLFLGQGVALASLSLTGMREDREKALAGRALACPYCGAAVEVKLASTRSLSCAACASVIDVSGGVAGDLKHHQQGRRYESPIPLGSLGTIDGVRWQAVGFARRNGVDEDNERFTWSEVLLHDPVEGFAFVVFASDGTSFVRAVQDAPQMIDRRTVLYQGRRYHGEAAYDATVEYVAGEFYWQVRRNQKTRNTDFHNGTWILSREEGRLEGGGSEVTWSHGERKSVSEVGGWFGIADLAVAVAGATGAVGLGALGGAPAGATLDADLASDALRAGLRTLGSPVSGSRGVWIVILIVVAVLLLVFWLADDDDGGGSFHGRGGGYSGGFHK